MVYSQECEMYVAQLRLVYLLPMDSGLNHIMGLGISLLVL